MNYRKYKTGALSLLLSVLLLSGCSAAPETGSKTADKAPEPDTLSTDGAVAVSTVDEFLAAIAPNTTIVFEPGEYELSSASSFGSQDTDSMYFQWASPDKEHSQLQILNTEGLTLKAAEAGTVTLSNSDADVSVLFADSCPKLTISNMSFRHTKEDTAQAQPALSFFSCDNLTVESSSIYDSGAAGLALTLCQSPRLQSSVVNNCAGAAVTLDGCWEALIDGCEFSDCGSASLDQSLIRIRDCTDTAVINSNIHENENSWMANCKGSKSIYLGGLNVHSNKFRALFYFSPNDVTVESCNFIGNDMYQWYYTDSTGFAVSPEGEYLSGEALSAMTHHKNVEWTPKSQTEMPEIELKTGGDGTVYVSTVDELLTAIAPNTTISLEKGVYDLSTASNYGAADSGSEFYAWEKIYDGAELQIRGVDGLTITAADPDQVTIATAPRYADVMSFSSCKELSLSNLTVGHNIEPGYCAGGVLYFSGCGDTDVDNCRLYGCGIVGVTAENCDTLHVRGTDIYDCSYGAVDIKRSRNVLLDNCDVYDCQVVMDGLISFVGCDECAYINSEIYNNGGISRVVYSSYTQGLYLASLDVHDNEFPRMLYSYPNSPTVTGCAFTDNYVGGEWYGSIYEQNPSAKAVDETGRELSESDLKAMSLGAAAAWEAQPKAEPQSPTEPEVSDDGAVHVATVDELLAAIAPDTVIYLEDGVYDLSAAAGYGSSIGKYCSWVEQYDGPELLISGVSGLTIKGGGADKVTISATPRYANVLRFDNCSDIGLFGFTAGHTQEEGFCTGGVLMFNATDNVTILECSLYGCGILGIDGNDCENMLVSKTEIYDCSSGGVSFYGCSKVAMVGCNLHDNGGADYMYSLCAEMTVDGEPMPNY